MPIGAVVDQHCGLEEITSDKGDYIGESRQIHTHSPSKVSGDIESIQREFAGEKRYRMRGM